MSILVTGGAGFIGYHVCKKRLDMGDHIIAVDNLNDYYDVNLKNARLKLLEQYPNFSFIHLDLTDRNGVAQLFNEYPIDKVIHLAAQAGIRHSVEHPMAFIDSNLIGFSTILEGCRHHKIKHLVYASSSSVYGGNQSPVCSERDSVDHPLTIYAATKRYNELAAHAYSNLYKLPTTGLRFFSVYGPWSRPDMAIFKFTKNILEDKPINVYNHGNMLRDFTYIDDIVEGVSRILDSAPTSQNRHVEAPNTNDAPFRIYNIGNGKAVPLMDYVRAIELALGKEAEINFLPMQDGDAYSTCSDVDSLFHKTAYRPTVGINQGVLYFVNWYKSYY